MAGTFDVRVDEQGVAFCTIDHRAKLNTLNVALMQRIIAALTSLGDRTGLRCVVLTGAGDRAFIGGADIREMAALRDPIEAERFIRSVHGVCDAVRRIPVPVIARIDGYCLGAGLEFAAACDLRIASSRSQFAMPEVRVGIPSVVEAALLPGLIGWGRTRRLLLLGETVAAETMLDWGFLERVVTAGELDEATEAWVECVLLGGPEAIRRQKALIAAWEGLPLGAAIAAGIPAFGSAFTTDEPARLMRGFLDRPGRKPTSA